MHKYDVYAIGNALVDTEIEVTDEFLQANQIEKGMMTLVDEARQAELIAAIDDAGHRHSKASGGSAANSIIATAWFGGNTYYSCKVADDDFGRFYVDDLLAAGVDTNMKQNRPDGVSGKCLVLITPDAERTMNTYLGISATVAETELNEEAIQQSQYVYIEGFLVTSDNARAAACKLRETAKANNVKTALTFSDPAMAHHFADGLKEMLGDGVDLLFCNEEEALAFTGKEDMDDAIQVLLQYSRQLVITLGSDGALLHDGEQTHKVEPVSVKAVDTTGAGDMFAGAFLYAITNGHDFPTAGKLASAAAAKVVSDFGPRLPAEQHAQLKQEILGE